MYNTHPNFESPDDQVHIWRFIDFTKFVDILESSSLYFSRPDLLGDPFEGTYARLTIDNIDKDPTLLPDQKQRAKYFFTNSSKNWKNTCFVNCWHINNYEPYSMWKTYTSNNQGVAIQSTFEKLKNCINDTTNVFIGKVKYIDYGKEEVPWGNAFLPLLHKRKNFEHESELRAISFNLSTDPHNPPAGVYVKINLDILIENIVVSPTSPSWFKDLVRAILKKFNVDKPVINSQLDEKPIGL
ncbi:MAG: DUF2971 domain-containing protein [Nitrososphaera sp.]|jgi:competence transcription factor ComK